MRCSDTARHPTGGTVPFVCIELADRERWQQAAAAESLSVPDDFVWSGDELTDFARLRVDRDWEEANFRPSRYGPQVSRFYAVAMHAVARGRGRNLPTFAWTSCRPAARASRGRRARPSGRRRARSAGRASESDEPEPPIGRRPSRQTATVGVGGRR